MSEIHCSKCGFVGTEGDRFCEECGTAISVEVGCEKCGAGVKEIDGDGYCLNCGFRREVKQRDHFEVSLHLTLAGVSDRGLKHHRNEDYLALATVNDCQILVVCDGVSSSSQADVASEIAAISACQALTTAMQQGEHPEVATKTAFIAAGKSVCNIPDSVSINSEPPSTTIVTAIVQDRTATIGWLGDSRAYWLADTGSRQLTTDDSWLTEVVAAGKMTEVEANLSPQAHSITRWLGADANDESTPGIINFTIPGSGYLLLCSDGLWNYASVAELAQVSPPSVEALIICRQLVEFARNCGGHDNISVAVLSFVTT